MLNNRFFFFSLIYCLRFVLVGRIAVAGRRIRSRRAFLVMAFFGCPASMGALCQPLQTAGLRPQCVVEQAKRRLPADEWRRHEEGQGWASGRPTVQPTRGVEKCSTTGATANLARLRVGRAPAGPDHGVGVPLPGVLSNPPLHPEWPPQDPTMVSVSPVAPPQSPGWRLESG